MKVAVIFILIGVLQMASVAMPSLSFAAATCSRAHSPSLAKQALNIASNSLARIVRNVERPHWRHFTEALELVQSLEGIKDPKKIESLKRTLKKDLKTEREKLDEFYGVVRSNPEAQVFFESFLDYHYAYFKLLERANKMLGERIFAVPDLSNVLTNAQTQAEGAKIVRTLETYAEKTFHLTGYETYQSYLQATRNHSNKASEMIDFVENDVVIGMHRPESARFWIPITGFQNQRVTGSSNGVLFTQSSIKIPSGRDNTEAFFAGLSVAEFVPLSARIKPNYAEAMPSAENQKIRPSSSADGYGSDVWVIKKSVAEKRATWVPDDSLNRQYSAKFGKDIQSIFLPWAYRGLMVPYGLEYYHKGRFHPGDYETAKPKLPAWTGSMYFEVQVWGALTLSDVQAFRFRKNPPDKKFYQLLVSNGIKVWDERSWPAKVYLGEESK